MRRLLQIPRSLAFKVFAVVLALLVLSAAYPTWTHIRSCRERFRDNAHMSADRIADSIQRSTRESMLRYRPEELRRTIDTLGEQTGILRIRILNKTGKIVYSSDPGERGTLLDKSAEQCYACHARDRPLERLDREDRVREFQDASGHHALGVISPIVTSPDCSSASCHAHPASQSVLGVLDVNMSLDQLDRGYEEGLTALLTHTLFLVPVLAVLLGALVWVLLHARIRALIRGTREVAQGRLDTVIEVGGRDEIGDLAQSFNGMTASLRAAQDELRRWSHELEEKVREKSEELTRVQQEVFAAEKLASIGRLAAGVAHEINSPLGGIQVFAGLLLEDPPPQPAEVREKVGRIANEAARCRKIVQGLLEFARSQPLAPGRVELGEVADEALSLVETQSVIAKVAVQRERDGPVPPVDGDVDQLRQVLLNIILNAAEAIDGPGEITIRTREAREGDVPGVEISILDSGPGIPERDLERIFEPFFTTKEPGKGTGLGLAVCFGIVDRHGGRIRAFNRPEGGAGFAVWLPLRHGEGDG